MIADFRTITLGIYEQTPCGWQSREDGVVEGTVRVIEDQLWYAWTIHKGGWWDKDKVFWLRVTEKQLQGINKLPSQRATE
jgi:hypothetical protein